jgi:hypothetical protein
MGDHYEVFEKRSVLFKFKEDEDFNHRQTLSISRIGAFPPEWVGSPARMFSF